jgi:sorting nexin-1/2
VRRFRDFVWLHDKVAESNKGIIIPPLPEKNAVQKFQMATDFIEQRRKALAVFLARVAAHPALRNSAELQLFLEGTDEEWGVEQAKMQVQASNAKEKLTGALGWFKSLQHSATNLVQGKTDDSLEDPEYLKQRDYINQLEGHLAEAQRHASRLVRKEQELGAAVFEFGQALDRLGRLEDGSVQEAFIGLSQKTAALSAAARERVEALSAKFEAPMKESVRFVRSVQAVCGDRAAALSGLQQAKNDLDARKVGRRAGWRGGAGPLGRCKAAGPPSCHWGPVRCWHAGSSGRLQAAVRAARPPARPALRRSSSTGCARRPAPRRTASRRRRGT